MKSWVNGQEIALVSLYDRGLQYGDGVFETMRIVDGHIYLQAEHLTRLQTGCQQLGIEIDFNRIMQQVAILQKDKACGVVKLIVTRGESERGYKTLANAPATLICQLSTLSQYPGHYYKDGVDVWLCKTIIGRNPLLAGIKHLNRLENILARQEWSDEYQEGLMCDEHGNVIEGTMSNFFAVINGNLVTPSLNQSGVAGIVRQLVLDIARKDGISVSVRDIQKSELANIDAALLTNSLIGAWPVRRIAQYEYVKHQLCSHIIERVMEHQN